MNRINLLKTTGFVAAGVLVVNASLQAKEQVKKPNIIFILADDLGYAEIGCNGADKYKTPNIDKLASDGMRFTNAYTAPLSGPSRSMILTGRHLFRTGATNQDACVEVKPTAESLIPTYLKKAGYVSTMIGKQGQMQLEPSDWGYDDYLRFNGSGIYWNTQEKGKTYMLNGVITALKDKEYMPDVMHNKMVEFMTQNKNKPFFAYYSLSHVHGEILPTPDSKADSKNIYDDNIRYMDKLVGQLREELVRLKLDKNTILVFFGDNGTAKPNADAATIGGRRLIGQKGSMQEGGALVPMLVYWPRVTPKGKVSNDLISAVDFLPTFADIAGVQLPTDKIFDGQSFKAQLHGQKGNPRSSIYIQLARNWYVRNSEFKLNQKGELYDMSKAPFEEILVPADSQEPKAVAARKSLQAELDRLNPQGGFIDTGDESGRHASNVNKKGKKDKKEDE